MESDRSPVDSLIAGMLNQKLYVMLRRTVRAELLTDELVALHLKWMITQERKGVIFASGPFIVPGRPRGAGGGMTVLRATDEQEATAIGDTDPFVAAGAVEYELLTWMLMEGGLRLTVSYSTGQFELG
ncbi:hypothetical protein JJQ59_37325 (plasmid) [Cupriavidus necator]|uniref:YCII-related domain-containing protein n=2 Tax=Cupriavidus necator TaxID=106590 RepID=A0A367PMZ5_CUPNE|nr:hypothetical protein JJQ59_37325 [Cupriavidus necator]RCJ08416.1 hypothetical protein DDK22_10925 [Cupriavidus necator]